MRILGLALLCAFAAATSALSQPLPNAIRSSALTRAQEDELNRRLGLLQSRLVTLASETRLREAAVRNIAIEIFGARPDLEFGAYAGLIDSGARQLRDYISAARQRTESDPALAALRERALSAAEDGRLSDARALYNELIAANRNARRIAREAEDLADAADIAEAGRLAFIATDFPEAARLYAEAADLAPVGARVRWLYRVMQSSMIMDESARRSVEHLADHAATVQAAHVLLDARTDAPADWRWILERLADKRLPDIDAQLYLAAAGMGAVQELYAPGNTPAAAEQP